MFAFSLLAEAVICLGLLAGPTETRVGPDLIRAGVLQVDVAENQEATTSTWTVWYRRPGQRWQGTSGLSYYHAARLRDGYLRKGWQSYVEPD